MRTTDAILAMLPTYPESLDTRTVALELGITSRDASARLCQLAQQGRVVWVAKGGVGRYAKPSTWAKPAVVEEVNP